MDSSLDFDDVTSPRTADHDDIDFDISTPRDCPTTNLQHEFHSSAEHSSEIPSIVITEPSSANLIDLDGFEPENQRVVTENAEDNQGDFSAEVTETSSSVDNPNNLNDIDLDVVQKDITTSQKLENDIAEVTDCRSEATGVDVSVKEVAEMCDFTDNEETVTAPKEKKEETEASEKLTDLQLSVSANMEEKVEDEVDDTVSLDNIMMKDKTRSDSDDEFDFDLPSGPGPSGSSSPPPPLPSQTGGIDNEASKPESSVATSVVPALIQGASASSPTALTSSNSSTESSVPAGSQEPYPGSPAPQASSSSTQKPVAVIKPTSQTPYVVQPPPDEGTQRVLEAAQAEWEKVTTIQAGYKEADTTVQGAEPTVVETVEPMSPHELLQIFKQENFSDVKSTIKPAVERHGLAAFVNFLFGPPKLHRDLIEQRDIVFCIAASQLNNDNSSHIRTLQTIYRCLTGSKFDCPRIGSHWEEIGFQGSDPGTDLRGAGLLGLMNLLHLLKDPKKYQLSSDIYRLSLHPTQNFPFCVMGINLSRITLQTLREGLLNKECNRRHDVIGVVNDFYSGLYLQLYKVWKGQGKTISDSGFVIKDLEMKAKKSPRDVFRSLDEYFNKKTVVKAEKSLELGGDNFVNVCDDTT